MDAQYIPAYKPDSTEHHIADVEYWHKGNLFKHLEVSLTAGTTGIGIDLAAPLSQYVQIRLGYDYMPRIKKKLKFEVYGDGTAPVKRDDKGNRVETAFDKITAYYYEVTGREIPNEVTLAGKTTMSNLKLLVDVYPIKYNKNLHFTAGLYWGPKEFGRLEQTSDSKQALTDIAAYNKAYREAGHDDRIADYGLLSIGMGNYSHNFQQGPAKRLLNANYQMEPTDDGRVEVSLTSSAIKGYLGLGYGGRLIPKRNDWKISAELGAMIWGGTPSQTTHDGTDLSKDVKDYPCKAIKVVKALKVYPVLSVRVAKTLF